MSSTRRVVGFASLTAAALVAGLLAGPFTATAAARPSSGLADRVTAAEASRADARAALARAQELFAPLAVQARAVATPVEATMLLRDLALAAPSLGRAGRQAAHAILARPGDPTANDAWGVRSNLKACNARLCVRWTTRGADAPPDRDRDRDGKPNQVELTLKVVNAVWSAEVGAMGFRPPLTDQRGSYDSADDRFDVYLSDLPNGLYGYCTPDDTRTRRSSSYAFYDVAAYCVLDDDYARSEFPSGTPASNLRTTAAHEFHHAVQFGYDWTEDTWLMESTSTWIEDEVYDGVNDNLQFLPYGQLKNPERPLDFGSQPTWYGNWIFLRWLSEKYGAGVVRQIWDRVDGSRVGPDDYSTLGIANVVSDQGATMADVYALFAAANQTPAARYSEGSSYPSAPRTAVPLSAAEPSSGTLSFTLNHLTSSAVRFVPDSGLGAATLNVFIDAPALANGGRAVLVQTGSGGVTTTNLAVDAAGDGAFGSIPFDPANVTAVTVVLVNGGAKVQRSTCFERQTVFACGGAVSLSDGEAVSVSAALGT